MLHSSRLIILMFFHPEAHGVFEKKKIICSCQMVNCKVEGIEKLSYFSLIVT